MCRLLSTLSTKQLISDHDIVCTASGHRLLCVYCLPDATWHHCTWLLCVYSLPDATWHHCTWLLRVYHLPDATWHHCTRLAAKLYWLLLRLSYITEPWLVTELQQTGFIFTNKPVFSARPFPKGTVPLGALIVCHKRDNVAFGDSNCLPQKRQYGLWFHHIFNTNLKYLNLGSEYRA